MKQPTLWTRDVSSLGQAVWEGAVITTALYRLPTTCGKKIHNQGWPSSLGKPLRVGILMLTSNTLNGNTDGKHSCTVTYTRLLHITIPCSHQEKLGGVSVQATELLCREWGSLESKVEQPSSTWHMVMVACYTRWNSQQHHQKVVRTASTSRLWIHTTCIVANNWCNTYILLHLGSAVWLAIIHFIFYQ